MTTQNSTQATMVNTLNKIEVYRTKAIMIMEASVAVSYNAATPMVQFKFAQRADAKSGGNWNNNQNAYWFPSFSSLVDAVTQMSALLTATAGSDTAIAKFSNPKKQKYLQIRKNVGDNSELWYVFSYMSGAEAAGNQMKINCSCTQSEFNGIIGYLKNMLTQFPTIGQMALMRFDSWYQYVGKFKTDSNGGENSQSYSNNKPAQNQYKSDKSPAKNAANSINGEYGGTGNDFDSDDIPF